MFVNEIHLHRQYNLRSIYEKFTPRVCTALLGFHAMTGSDQTGKFNGFTKKTCWDTFIQSTDDILDAFIHLGTTDMNHDTDFKSLESFVVHLYSRNRVAPGLADSSELRWNYFFKNQSESQKMPPSSGTLCQKALRAHNTSLQQKSARIPSPQLPYPEDYGCKWDNQHQMYDAIMTTLPPAPESVIELTLCGCKTGCNTNRCKCLKNGGVKCIEMRKCYNYENVESDEFLNLRDHVIEEFKS